MEPVSVLTRLEYVPVGRFSVDDCSPGVADDVPDERGLDPVEGGFRRMAASSPAIRRASSGEILALTVSGVSDCPGRGSDPLFARLFAVSAKLIAARELLAKSSLHHLRLLLVRN